MTEGDPKSKVLEKKRLEFAISMGCCGSEGAKERNGEIAVQNGKRGMNRGDTEARRSISKIDKM